MEKFKRNKAIRFVAIGGSIALAAAVSMFAISRAQQPLIMPTQSNNSILAATSVMTITDTDVLSGHATSSVAVGLISENGANTNDVSVHVELLQDGKVVQDVPYDDVTILHEYSATYWLAIGVPAGTYNIGATIYNADGSLNASFNNLGSITINGNGLVTAATSNVNASPTPTPTPTLTPTPTSTPTSTPTPTPTPTMTPTSTPTTAPTPTSTVSSTPTPTPTPTPTSTPTSTFTGGATSTSGTVAVVTIYRIKSNLTVGNTETTITPYLISENGSNTNDVTVHVAITQNGTTTAEAVYGKQTILHEYPQAFPLTTPSNLSAGTYTIAVTVYNANGSVNASFPDLGTIVVNPA